MNLEALERQIQFPYVLVVFPCDENRGALLKAIAQAGRVPLLCDSFEEAQEVIEHEDVRIVVCEDHLPKKGLEAILDLARKRTRPIPVIIASRTGGWTEFLRALRQGAFDYLVLPPQPGEVRRVLELAMAEGAQTEASATGAAASDEEPDVEPIIYSFEDRWRNPLDLHNPVFSRQMIPGHAIRETK